jgi:hypothetical protein
MSKPRNLLRSRLKEYLLPDMNPLPTRSPPVSPLFRTLINSKTKASHLCMKKIRSLSRN